MQAEIIDNVSRLPGVEAAAFADGLPMEADYHNGSPWLLKISSCGDRLLQIAASSGFSWPICRARDSFLGRPGFHVGGPVKRRLVAIVSESMARENWGQPGAALGKRLGSGATGRHWFEVVGVVEDVHDDGAHKAAPPIVYFRTGVHDPWRPGQPAIDSPRSHPGDSKQQGEHSRAFFGKSAAAIHEVNPSLPLGASANVG